MDSPLKMKFTRMNFFLQECENETLRLSFDVFITIWVFQHACTSKLRSFFYLQSLSSFFIIRF